MKRIATITASALVALGMGLLATAASKLEKVQPANGYVKVDQKLIEEAAEAIANSEKELSAKDKAYYKSLVVKAFDKYKDGKASKVEVYEKAAIEKLNTEIKEGQDSVKKLNKKIVEKEKQNEKTIDSLESVLKKENIDGRIRAINEKHSNDSIAQANEITELKKEINRLRDDSIKFARSNAELAKAAEIAQIVNENVEKLWGKVDKLHDSYLKDQTLPSVDSIEVANTLKEYEDYLKTIRIEVPKEQKEKMEFVRAVARVAADYHKGKEILSKKYDAKAAEQWNAGAMAVKIDKLNDAQKKEWQNQFEAMKNIDATIKYFRDEIVQYVKEQGLLPTKEVVKDVKDYVELCVKNYADADYKNKGTFHPLYVHLNCVLKEMLDGLKIMNEDQYKAFVEKLEKSL